MATFVGAATGAGTSLALPAHQIGDLIIISAYRGTSALAPTLPGGWTVINTGAGNTNGLTIGYKVATSTSETSGTWTNAEIITAHVYNGQDATTPVGASALTTNITSATAPYPGLTLQKTDGSSLVAMFVGARSVASTLDTAPSGMAVRTNPVVNPSQAASYDTGTGVTSWPAGAVAWGTGGNRYRVVAVEIRSADAPATVNLTASSIAAGAPTLGTPALGQAHALAASGLVLAAPTLGAPAVAQAHGFTAAGIAAGTPTLGQPALGSAGASLTATSIAAGAPTVGVPAVSQAHALTAAGVSAGVPTLGAAALAQGHVIAATGISAGSPSLGAAALAGNHGVAAAGIAAGAPTFGQPALTAADQVDISAPAARIAIVPAENRTVTPAAEARVITVPVERTSL